MHLTRACLERDTMDKEIFETIHRRIKYIWEEKIKEDYIDGWLLKEDTLKNDLYHHLRNELSTIFAENDIRVFTEFTDGEFKGSKRRPDLVIATVDFEKEEHSGYYGDDIKECIAVFEIKFKCSNASDTIYADYDKLKDYIGNLGVNAHLYMATIWEEYDKHVTWIRKNAAWAKGRVTELNASYIIGTDREPQFYICEH